LEIIKKIDTYLYHILSARGRLGKSGAPTIILVPPHISEINPARKLKFGTLADICQVSGYM